MLESIIDNKKTLYIITDSFSRRYFSGITVDEGVLLIHDNKKYYFTDARYNYAVSEKLNGSDVISKLLVDSNSIKEFASALDYDILMLDYDKTTVTEYQEYKNWKKEIADFSVALKNLRAVKTEREIENIEKACQITEKAYYETLKQVKLGISERELCDILENNMLKFGAEGTSFSTIVAFSKNSAVPHHETGDTKLQDNSVILIDCGCKVNGYCSDFTRTAFFGVPSQEFIDCYNAVKVANEKAISNIYGGILCSDADKFSREYLEGKDLAKYFTHSLGHGLGLEIHEEPRLSPKDSESRLIENTVFTVEPGIYQNGKFGIRIEDTVVIKNGKAKRLFSDSKELIII